MAKVYTKAELQAILDMYANQETQDEAQAQAEQLLKDFASENADVEQDSLKEFQQILETFGMTVNEEGQHELNEIGAQAAARFESIISSLENAENATDESRIYSLTSDQNQIKFDLVTLNIYKEMGLVNNSVDPANMTPQQVAETIEKVSLNDKQRAEYSNKFIDNIIGNQELFEITPPKILTDAYIFAREQWQKNPNDKYLNDRFKTLAERIDYLIKNFAKKVDYFYSDPSNIADVYDGYRKMCNIRAKDLQIIESDNEATKKYKAEVKQYLDDTNARLEEIVSMYSELWNLKNLKPEDAEKLDARWKEISEKLKDVELTDEILAVLAKYEFLDEDGKPMPQFIDAEGKPQQDFQPGYKLNPEGRLNRIIMLAKSDVTMRNVGDLEHNVQDIDLASALFDRVPWKMAEISVPDQSVSGIESKPQTMLDQQEVDTFWDNLGKEGGSITGAGYQAALDAQVNQAAGWAGMIANQIGTDKDVVMRPFEAVKDIDKLASTRSEKQGAAGRKKKMNFFGRMLRNFSSAALVSAGLTFIGKATGVAYAGAAIGTALGIGNMVYQGFKWRKAQKAAGRPYGLGAFLSDKRNWGPAVASGLGVAAVINMATGNPELAAGLGIGAMAVGGTSAAVMTYKDAINSGYTKGQAIAGALGVVGATIAGGFAGRAAMNSVISYVNNNTDSNLFKTETTTTTNTEVTERVYDDGVIDHHERMMLNNNWETQESFSARVDGLMDAGLSHDDAVRYLLAWHDATDHNLGPGYFDSIGMNADALSALRGSIDGANINLTPESIAAFEQFNPHISASNTVGYIPGAPVSYDLPGNATYDSNGVIIPGNDFYSTYVEHGQQVFQDIPIISTETNSIFTPNELAFPAGIGAFGIYEPRVVPDEYLNNMRERAGALADRAERIERQRDPVNNPTIHDKPADEEEKPVAEEDKPVEDKPADEEEKPVAEEDKPVEDKPADEEEKPVVEDIVPVEHNQPVEEAVVEDVVPTNKPEFHYRPAIRENGEPVIEDVEIIEDKPGEDRPVDQPGEDRPADQPGDDKPADEEEKPKSRGFFGTCKDITYKIMQSAYHGLQKTVRGFHNINTQIQQGVHEMKKQKIDNETDMMLARARAAKARKKAYKDLTIDEINETSLKDAAVIAQQNERLKRRLGEARLRLSAEFETADAKQKHELEQRLEQLKALQAEAEAFQSAGGEESLAAREKLLDLERKMRLLEIKTETDIAVAQEQGKNKVGDVRAEGSKSRARRFGQAIAGFFRGFGDTTKEDITSANNAVKLAEKRLAKAKTDGEKEVWQRATERLAEIMSNTELSEEQKKQMMDAVIKETSGNGK